MDPYKFVQLDVCMIDLKQISWTFFYKINKYTPSIKRSRLGLIGNVIEICIGGVVGMNNFHLNLIKAILNDIHKNQLNRTIVLYNFKIG